MSQPTLYGQAQSEKFADENKACRQIVKEINNFGVTQRQMLMIVYLMAMELENIDHMRTITKLVRQICPEMFLIGTVEPDHEIQGGNNGPTDV